MSNQLNDKIVEIFSTLFKRTININENLSMESEPKWDSMKHIEVIMVLEEELGITFKPETIPSLTSMSKIIEEIRNL